MPVSPAPPAPPSQETARYFRDPRLGEVELLRATFVTQRFARHVHEGYALGVIETGGLRFDYLGREHRAAQGSVNLVEPGEPHNGDAGGGAGWSYRMLYLQPELVRRAAEQIGIRAQQPHFPSGVLQDAPLAARLRELHGLLETRAGSALELDARLLGLLVRWVALHAEGPPHPPRSGAEPSAVRRALELLHARWDSELRLEELARVAGLSPFHLVRVFGKAMGVPPSRYLVQLRVARARRMLAEARPLAEVAVACGFADQSHLTREFKRILGVPPGRYRKMIQD